MITSMTGYGEATVQGNGWYLSIKIKTLNHKYLDLQVKGLEEYEALELQALEALKRSFQRGRIEVAVDMEREGDSPPSIDLATVRQHYEELQQIVKELHLDEPVTLDHVLRLGGALKPLPPDANGLWPLLEPVLQEAVAAVKTMRCQEGKALAVELTQLCETLGKELSIVEAQAPALKRTYKERFQQRIRELAPGIELDPARIEQEIAIWAERTDITEEIARLKIHLIATQKVIEGAEPAGRTLDFLAQEMYREVNTMSAKARDAEIAQQLIEAKGQIERIREQVRNVE